MISAPIIFEEHLFGVVNILSHHSNIKSFTAEWQEWLSALAVLYGAALARVERFTPHRGTLKIEIGMEEKSSNPRSEDRHCGNKPSRARGSSPVFKAGRSDIPVLICGETGTGKELAAHRIHEASRRVQGPF